MITASRSMASPLVHVDAKPRGLPDEIGDSRLAGPAPFASHSLSRSGRPARQAKYEKGWAI